MRQWAAQLISAVHRVPPEWLKAPSASENRRDGLAASSSMVARAPVGDDWSATTSGMKALQPVTSTGRRIYLMSILWIILIVILVLALLGFFGRGRF